MSDAVFIRHHMSSTPRIVEQLWEQRLIALHYGNNWSIVPADYDRSGKRSLQMLLDFCATGVLVGADYRKKGGVNSMLVGELVAGTLVIAKEFSDGDNRFVYKIAQLHNVREISYEDFPLLAAVQPPNVTICEWPSVAKQLRAIFKGKNLPLEVSSLAPSQLEVLCYEYLRAQDRIASLLLPIGRALKDIDIVGIDAQKQPVCAQVTASDDPKAIQRKTKLMKDYDNAILFAPEKMRQYAASVEFISNEEVFKRMSDHPVYSFILRKMLQYDN